MNITARTALVTGANRGLGRALVTALLDVGAAKVYATARDLSGLPTHDRVVPLRLELTDPASVAALASSAPDTELLINNAGAAAFASPLDADLAAVAHELAVNYTGLATVARAFAPVLAANRGAMVNVLTLLSYAPAPSMAGYSAAKAAAHSLTLSLRSTLARQGIAVHGVYPSGIDTDMLAGWDVTKAAPADVAAEILAGIGRGDEDIYPDPVSAGMSELWSRDPRAFAAQFAAMGA